MNGINMKPLLDQDLKVRCIKANEDFRLGEEYSATYLAPWILNRWASFEVLNGFVICSYSWEEFYEHFEILTEDFEGIPSIEIGFVK